MNERTKKKSSHFTHTNSITITYALKLHFFLKKSYFMRNIMSVRLGAHRAFS